MLEALNRWSAVKRSGETGNIEDAPPRSSWILAVKCSTRITLENNGKIRPQPDRENAFARASGGDEVRKLLFIRWLSDCFC